jgi:hypothetical protein
MKIEEFELLVIKLDDKNVEVITIVNRPLLLDVLRNLLWVLMNCLVPIMLV